MSGWLSSAPDEAAGAAAAAAASSSNPTCAPRSAAGCGTGASPEGSILVPGRGRRRGGGEIQDSAAVELLHSGWLKDRGQEFPVAPAAAPPELSRFPVVSANFLLPPLPLHRLEPALPLTTRPPWLPALGRTPSELVLLQPLTDGPSPQLPLVLLPAK